MPRKKIIRFFLIMVLFSSIIIAASDTWYLLYGKNSLSVTIPMAFPGLEIRDGILHPHNGSPYAPPAYLIAPVFNQLLKLPSMLNSEADSLVIIDTATSSQLLPRAPVMMLKSKEVIAYYNEKSSMRFPYEQLLSGSRNFEFTREQIVNYLKKNSITIYILYFFSSIIHDGIMFLVCIFFLAFAAFIFRIDRQKTFQEYVKIAVHAISPVVIGGMLVSVAGVKIEWVWQLLIFLSTIIMFRAIIAVGNSKINTRK